MPSVTTRSRVSAVKRRSKRTCQPTSRPSVQPRSSAMRAAIARAATRRGWSRMTGPSATSAGGTRVVLPAPGEATTTAARARRTSSTIESMYGSIGSGLIAPAPQLPQPRVTAAPDAVDAVRGGVRLVVVLVVLLAAPEGGQRQDLRHHAVEAARSDERVLRRLRGALLRLVFVEDDRPVL